MSCCPFPATRSGRTPSVEPAGSRKGRREENPGSVDKMIKSHKTYLSVPMQDGKALRMLTEATGAKSVVEYDRCATPAIDFITRAA